MDSNEEIERLLNSINQRQEEFNKQTLDTFKEFAKQIKAMSADERKFRTSEAKERQNKRLRDEARAKRQEAVNKGSGGLSKDQAVNDLKSTVKKAGTHIESFTGALRLSTDNLHDFVGVLKSLPVVGGLVAGALGGLVVNGIQTTVDSFRSLNKHGIILGDSIFDLNIAATKAGMGIKDFSDLASRYSGVINHYGISAMMDFNEQLKASGSGLRNMGLTTQDITEFMFDYLEIQRKSGSQVNLDKLQDRIQAEKFAKTLDNLATITGQSLDELRKKTIDTISNPNFNAMMQSLGDPSLAKNIELFAASLKDRIPGIDDMLANLVAGTSNKELAMLPAQVRSIFESVIDGSITADKALVNLKKWSTSISPEELRTMGVGGIMGSDYYNFISSLRYNSSTLEPISDQTQNAKDNYRKSTNVFNTFMQKVYENTWLPMFENLKKGFSNNDPAGVAQRQKLMDELLKTSSALGETLGSALSPANIHAVSKGFTDLIAATNNLVGFLNQVSGGHGIIATALTVAFGPKLLGILTSAVGNMVSGSITSSAVGGTAGLTIGKAFMRTLGLAGIGINLAGMVADGINGTIDSGTIGTGAGTIVGGFAGAFFGQPLLGAAIGGWLGGVIGDMFKVGSADTQTIEDYWQQRYDSATQQIDTLKTKSNELASLGDNANKAELDLLNQRIAIATDQQNQAQAQLDKITTAKATIEAAQAKIADIDERMNKGLIAPEDLSSAIADKNNQQAIINAGNQSISNINTETSIQRSQFEAIKKLWVPLLNSARLDMMFSEAHLSQNEKNQLRDVLTSGIDSPEKIKGIQNVITRLMTAGSNTAADTLAKIPDNLKYGDGGVAATPSIFGEAGPEAAIPLDNGLRIPIAQIDMRGMDEIQRLSANLDALNDNLLKTLTGMKNSFDRYLSNMVLTNQNKEEKEILLGIYSQLEDIAGTNTNLVRNSRLLSD